MGSLRTWARRGPDSRNYSVFSSGCLQFKLLCRHLPSCVHLHRILLSSKVRNEDSPALQRQKQTNHPRNRRVHHDVSFPVGHLHDLLFQLRQLLCVQILLGHNSFCLNLEVRRFLCNIRLYYSRPSQTSDLAKVQAK